MHVLYSSFRCELLFFCPYELPRYDENVRRRNDRDGKQKHLYRAKNGLGKIVAAYAHDGDN